MPSSHDAEKIVAAARSWVGTPYQHQAQLKHVGVDCVGVILGTGKEAGFMGQETDELFRRFDGYSRVPSPRRMRKGMELFLEEVPFPILVRFPPPGVIAWMQWRQDLPMHLGVIAEFDGRATMIHAYAHAAKCVEITFDATWQDRVHSFWRYRGSDV